MGSKDWSPKNPDFVPFVKGNTILPKGGKYPEDALVVILVSEDRKRFQASPEHGGRVWNFDLTAIGRYGFRFVQPEELRVAWRQGNFAIDGIDGVFRGWTTGELWNGWATPSFEKKETERLMKAFTESKLSYGLKKELADWKYDKAKDAFVYYDSEGEGLSEDQGFEMTWRGKTRMLYPIGDGWTWSEEAEEA